MYTKKGMFFKLAHELAGLGGDTAFYKAETESQIARPLSDSVVSSLAIFDKYLTSSLTLCSLFRLAFVLVFYGDCQENRPCFLTDSSWVGPYLSVPSRLLDSAHEMAVSSVFMASPFCPSSIL